VVHHGGGEGGADVARDLRPLAALQEDYTGPLHAYALRRLGDRRAAEEVVQDTFVRAWRHADRFDPTRGSEAAWLFTIAGNLVIDRLRRRSARPVVSGTLDDRAAVTAPDVVDEPAVDRIIETWQLAEAMANLSDEHRTAIVLCHHRGHSVAEAADILEVPEGTVKSRVHYGLRALRLHLEEQGVLG
jgi:RNA polymerase sigma-70 factor, ECF subfamily